MDIDWSGVRFGDFDSNFMDEELQRRLRKTLYYGKNPLTDRTSLPVTELAVELLQHVAPKELGKIDTQLASSISRKACLSPCSLMLGLIYIDRLRQKSPEYLQQVSSADLFIVAMLVASKFLHDDGEDGVYNDEWAESAGIGTESVNELEREFLRAIDWNLLARSKEFEAKMEQLERSVALRKGKERLWKLSYTDLWVFLRNLECLQLFKANALECLKVFGAVVSAYVLGVIVLLLSLSTVATITSKLTHSATAVDNAKISASQSKLQDRLGFQKDGHDTIPLRPTRPCQQRNGDASVDVADAAAAEETPEAGRRPRCCKRWSTFLTDEANSRCGHRCGDDALSALTHFCNCNEKAMGRNLMIQENAFNYSFAQEKANDSWVHFDGPSETLETGLRPPLNVKVFG